MMSFSSFVLPLYCSLEEHQPFSGQYHEIFQGTPFIENTTEDSEDCLEEQNSSDLSEKTSSLGEEDGYAYDKSFLNSQNVPEEEKKPHDYKKPLLLPAPPDSVNAGFDCVKISLASPDQIRSWSYGEVKKPETINYRTFKPERDGLFCARIFGPIKDYECICGKYKRMKYKGIVCERCGVEVTKARVRRDRMGHIELASPVAHIWFSRSLPSRLGNLLDMTNKTLDRILYFDGYVVVCPGLTPLEYGQVLSDDEFFRAKQEYGAESFRVNSGAEALKEMLSNLNLEELCQDLRQELTENPSEMRRKKIIRRLKLVEAFLSSSTRPEWMILDVIPVMPPDLRPLVPLDGGRFATSDLNDLYRRLINRNNRLKRLLELQAPEMIIRNEKRMLQEIVDAFFDNGRRGRPILGSNKRPLKSLSDMIKGKQGRFRLNLLGKRVDYSGRSVIVVGPELKLHQCGLPKKMALELFKPFVYSRLERYGFASTLKAAKQMVEREVPEVWDALEDVIKGRTVLLNRAPTLHRLSIQAFEPILVDGKAIQLHPLVCAAYNADFDGDQMAVHIPLSLEAQMEARVLMMATKNVLNPANGEPVIVPSKDIVLGLYYLTSSWPHNDSKEKRLFAHLDDAVQAKEANLISLHDPIIARYNQCKILRNEEGEDKIIIAQERSETTLGRLILWSKVPAHPAITFDTVNKTLTSQDISKLVSMVYRYCGQEATVTFADHLVQLGFYYSSQSGISFGKNDLIVPIEKKDIVAETMNQVSQYQQQYLDGFITQGERYNKITDAWSQCTQRVADAMMTIMSKNDENNPMNSVYMMATSGARGSAAQMRQLAAMRGLIARHDGSIIERPIISNYREGLKTFEYFNSTHGSRKGLSDAALKTANAGYLTRRLVDVAQDCVVQIHDCGSEESMEMTPVLNNGIIILTLGQRVLGRVLAHDLIRQGVILLPKNHLIEEKDIDLLERYEIDHLRIRSVLMCKAKEGICALCYGRDLGRRRLATIGEAVGVIAAQSIGEPGTQLTLRTFQSGGAAQRGTDISFAEASHRSRVVFKNANMAINSAKQCLVMSKNMEILLFDILEEGGTMEGRELSSLSLPYGAVLLIKDGEIVDKGQKLAEWDPYTRPIIADRHGYVRYDDLINELSLKETMDEVTGITKYLVMDWQQNARSDYLRPALSLLDNTGSPLTLDSGNLVRYELLPDTIVLVSNGKEVHRGDILARLAKEAFKSRDITGGLPRIAELFEGRRPRDPAIMAECDGVIEFTKDGKAKKKLILVRNDGLPSVEYPLTKGRHVVVREGDVVKKGDILVDGSPVPHDILRILGVEPMAHYLIKEIQDVYRLQGVRINDKHVEVIIRQMLRKLEIIHPGDTTFLDGDQVSPEELKQANEAVKNYKGIPATAHPVLQGITTASLKNDSFISAASFQETTRVLIQAAIQGKEDKLLGLKENVIAGRLIPAGTGAIINQYKKEAALRDALALENEKNNLHLHQETFEEEDSEELWRQMVLNAHTHTEEVEQIWNEEEDEEGDDEEIDAEKDNMWESEVEEDLQNNIKNNNEK